MVSILRPRQTASNAGDSRAGIVASAIKPIDQFAALLGICPGGYEDLAGGAGRPQPRKQRRSWIVGWMTERLVVAKLLPIASHKLPFIVCGDRWYTCESRPQRAAVSSELAVNHVFAPKS
jgi:hypothetical protein